MKSYHEYYLCAIATTQSELRDGFFRKTNFEIPPDNIVEKLLELFEIFNLKDSYNVMAITDANNNVINYRVETMNSVTHDILKNLELNNFQIDSINAGDQYISIYIKGDNND